MSGIRKSTQWSVNKFPCADELHSLIHRIFSILKQVHPSERVASSAQVSREVTLETCIFCSKFLPLFSCKPLYRYKSLVVCLKELLHAIEFDRVAILLSDAPIYCIVMRSPSLFVRCDSGFVQIVLDFFQILIVVHRVHCCEEH